METKIDNITAFKQNAKAYNEAASDTSEARKHLQNATWNILMDNQIQEMEFLKAAIAKGGEYEKLKAVVSEVRLCFNNQESPIVQEGIDKGHDFGTIAKAYRKSAKTETAKDENKAALEAMGLTTAIFNKLPESLKAQALEEGKAKAAQGAIETVKARVIADLETLKAHAPQVFAEIIGEYVNQGRAVKAA